MIDTHCHLTHSKLAGDEAEIVARARQAGVAACISIGTGVEDAKRVRELTERHPGFLYGSAGIDPFSSHAAGDGFDEELAALDALLRDGGFVALGEIGLDYHYDLDPKPLQAERFERQLELAATLELPVVIHVRDAHDDMAEILANHPENRGVIHSFTGSPAEAERYLALDWYLAFNGVLTFRGAPEVREAARLAPLARLLIETDAPYLAPVPLRGKRCEPAYVRHTLEQLATTRGVSAESLAETTSINAQRLFGLG